MASPRNVPTKGMTSSTSKGMLTPVLDVAYPNKMRRKLSLLASRNSPTRTDAVKSIQGAQELSPTDAEAADIQEEPSVLDRLMEMASTGVGIAAGIPTGESFIRRAMNSKFSAAAREQRQTVDRELEKLILFARSPVDRSEVRITEDSANDAYQPFVGCLDYLLGLADQLMDRWEDSSPSCLRIQPRTGRKRLASPTTDVLRTALLEPEQQEKARPSKYGSFKIQSTWQRPGYNFEKIFIPSITFKHYGLSAIPNAIVEAQKHPTTVDSPVLPHPYTTEVSALDWSYPADHPDLFSLEHSNDQSENVPLVMVESLSALEDMIEDIREDEEDSVITVDLEHHHRHSYRGFTTLIQISTRNTDYIIDPFAMYKEMSRLNAIFCDPRKIKVFHGCTNDLMWLQRDFSVYVVHMWDTQVAARCLATPGGLSLANLLRVYCNLRIDKRLQLADWRIRPLTPEMKEYAKGDTRHLRHLFDRLRHAVLTRDATTEGQVTPTGRRLMQHVLEICREKCQVTYKHPIPDWPTQAREIVSQNKLPLPEKSVQTLERLLEWRDRLAREADECPVLLAGDGSLYIIARNLPLSWRQLSSCMQPLPRVVRENADQLLKIVLTAVAGDGRGLPNAEVSESYELPAIALKPSPREKVPGGSATTERMDMANNAGRGSGRNADEMMPSALLPQIKRVRRQRMRILYSIKIGRRRGTVEGILALLRAQTHGASRQQKALREMNSYSGFQLARQVASSLSFSLSNSFATIQPGGTNLGVTTMNC